MTEQNWPIKSELKSKRIKWITEMNFISWAFMKELRENNKTRKIYDVDPYVEVYQFRENMYGLFTENADGMGDVWMYLVIGPEKAMLIDTSFGIGNLKGLVDEITGGMPVIVVNTHCSFDHSFGNSPFGKAYCHEYAVNAMKAQNTPTRWDYLFDNDGNCIWMEFDREDIIPFEEYEIVGCPNGQIFNLGDDYDIELIWMPGHQAGHAMFLDKKGRTLFAGDDVCSDVIGAGGGPKPGAEYGEYFTIEAFRDELVKLVDRLDEFDYMFPGHFIVNLESALLIDILNTCNAIVENPQDCDFKFSATDKNGVSRERLFKYVRGFGSVGYTMNGVYKNKRM